MRSMTPMEKTMQALDAMKDVALPMDPSYYDDLHARIMTAVDRAESRPPAARASGARFSPSRFKLREHLKSWLTLIG